VRVLPRVRRAFTLHAYWKDGDLVVENFATRIAVSTDPITIQILGVFDRWRRREALARELPQYSASSLARAIRSLIRHSLLIEEGSVQARLGKKIDDTWASWLPHGGYHFATKDTKFAQPSAWKAIVRRIRAAETQPALTKSYPRVPTQTLPAPAPVDGEFLRVLVARKTHRRFTPEALSLDKLATLLHYTWGAMGIINTRDFGPLFHKTSPSGGARHPGEVYVASLRVNGLPRGIYHYNIRRHALERLQRGPMRAKMLRYALGQQHVGSACAVFMMTASFPRSMYKYKTARAYRVVTLETGHLAQTFCLVATWLGLAPFTTAAIIDTEIEKALGLDGVEESVLYIAGVGMPIVPAASTRRSTSAAAARPTRRR
jgi:SagB-type dehydrogenase family enzyme